MPLVPEIVPEQVEKGGLVVHEKDARCVYGHDPFGAEVTVYAFAYLFFDISFKHLFKRECLCLPCLTKSEASDRKKPPSRAIDIDIINNYQLFPHKGGFHV